MKKNLNNVADSVLHDQNKGSGIEYMWSAIGLGAVCIAFFWSHWGNLADLWQVWHRSDEYSSGLLVPVLAGFILWFRRDSLKSCDVRPWWLGIVVLLGAQTIRVLGVYHYYGSVVRLSVVAGIAALVIWLGGLRLFAKTAGILLFLCLMLPWPNRIQRAMTLPLQDWATKSTVFCLETVGYDIVQRGNIITIGDTQLAVSEAANGLRTVTLFLVITGVVALLSRRRWYEKLLIFVSGLPIALVCNTIRLTVRCIAFTQIEGDHWVQLFHDFGGYAMIPFALALVVLELWLIMLVTKPVTPIHRPKVQQTFRAREFFVACILASVILVTGGIAYRECVTAWQGPVVGPERLPVPLSEFPMEFNGSEGQNSVIPGQ
jgi:exosortase